MPSNLELKRSLEQTRKELSNKNKEIEQLNAKLSSFLELKESDKVNKDVKIAETVCINTENTENTDTNTDTNNNGLCKLQESTQSPDSKPIKKRKKSLWYLYLW